LSGMTAETERTFKEHGIVDLRELLRTDPSEIVALLAKSRISLEQVGTWQKESQYILENNFARLQAFRAGLSKGASRG
jgi:hypothetical protein